MAKKSNKTEHVLKLITKNDEAMQDDDFFHIDQQIGDNGTSAVRDKTKETPAAATGPAAVHQTDAAGEVPPQVKKADSEPHPKKAADPEPPQEKTADPEFPQKKKVNPEPAQTLEETPVPEPQKEPATIRAFREQEKAGSAILEQSDNLVNIAEILAKEKIALVMERMKVCTCKTCVNDVLALALNSLPTKYVTTDSGKQYFQLDIYKKQYETDILAALTKACVRVKASPRH